MAELLGRRMVVKLGMLGLVLVVNLVDAMAEKMVEMKAETVLRWVG
jgi:hypothetical protein